MAVLGLRDGGLDGISGGSGDGVSNRRSNLGNPLAAHTANTRGSPGFLLGSLNLGLLREPAADLRLLLLNVELQLTVGGLFNRRDGTTHISGRLIFGESRSLRESIFAGGVVSELILE